LTEFLELPEVDLDHPDIPLWSRAGFLIRRLNQIHYALFLEECTGFDLTPIQYGLISELAEHPGIDQITLSQEVGIDRSNTADILRRLELRGLVKRYPSPEDRRMKLSILTDKGEQVRREMYACMLRAQDQLLEPLSDEQKKNFQRLLAHLVRANNHLGRTLFRPS
jgi:DNA-binding MarR family transcriptional regulator